ncbi:MAG: hypothetical protein R6U98_11495 [Pirellulaceae bacterium]
MPAAEFSPVTLKKYQKALVERGDARSYINKPIGIIKYMFRWGVSEDLVPVATYQALATVSDLRRGRTKASEAVLRHPVDWDDVKPTLWHVNRSDLALGNTDCCGEISSDSRPTERRTNFG